MKKKINLLKILIWVASYVDLVAFAIVGGYSYFKLSKEKEDLKSTVKYSLIAHLIFLGIFTFFNLIGYFGQMFDNYYSSTFYDVINIITNLFRIIKIVFYALVICMMIFKPKAEPVAVSEEKKVENSDKENA